MSAANTIFGYTFLNWIQIEPYYMVISENYLIQELLNSLVGEQWKHFNSYIISFWQFTKEYWSKSPSSYLPIKGLCRSYHFI